VNVIRDRPEAELLPSRRRFALAKLIAFVRASLARERTPPATHVSLAIDRDQDAVEMYSVGAWYTLTTAIYVVALTPLPLPFAIATSVVLTPWIIQIPFYISGGVIPAMRNRDNRTLNSVWMLTLLTIASSFVAVMPTPARFVAWFFFGVIALNAIAFVILWMLRGKVRELETRCGA
jgi:hypothetical protein